MSHDELVEEVARLKEICKNILDLACENLPEELPEWADKRFAEIFDEARKGRD